MIQHYQSSYDDSLKTVCNHGKNKQHYLHSLECVYDCTAIWWTAGTVSELGFVSLALQQIFLNQLRQQKSDFVFDNEMCFSFLWLIRASNNYFSYKAPKAVSYTMLQTKIIYKIL